MRLLTQRTMEINHLKPFERLQYPKVMGKSAGDYCPSNQPLVTTGSR